MRTLTSRPSAGGWSRTKLVIQFEIHIFFDESDFRKLLVYDHWEMGPLTVDDPNVMFGFVCKQTNVKVAKY